jgi:hypothetical protein
MSHSGEVDSVSRSAVFHISTCHASLVTYSTLSADQARFPSQPHPDGKPKVLAVCRAD